VSGEQTASGRRHVHRGAGASKNHGGAPDLDVDGSPNGSRTEVDLSAVPGPVRKAMLDLRSIKSSVDAGAVTASRTDWSEGSGNEGRAPRTEPVSPEAGRHQWRQDARHVGWLPLRAADECAGGSGRTRGVRKSCT
jgi:hypothetical protein